MIANPAMSWLDPSLATVAYFAHTAMCHVHRSRLEIAASAIRLRQSRKQSLVYSYITRPCIDSYSGHFSDPIDSETWTEGSGSVYYQFIT